MIDHAAEGARIIDEYFKTDAEMSEEAKLWEGLCTAVRKGWFSKEEAEECMEAYIDKRGDTIETQPST